ncbi:MAG: class F sortase [Marmoricola sp.]
MPPLDRPRRALLRRLARTGLVAVAAAVVAVSLIAAHLPGVVSRVGTAVARVRLAATGPAPQPDPLATLVTSRRANDAAGAPARRVGAGVVPPDCRNPTREQFSPTRITIPGILSDAPVLALPRDPSNHPGVAPVDESGKHEFAWDRPPGLMPGTVGGNVLLNAHTWPWDAAPALGNLMLLGLHVGDVILVEGTDAHLCYRVTDRVQQPADSSFSRYYAVVGPPQLAIMVCSGVRRGPEDWADRTVWFATPIGT